MVVFFYFKFDFYVYFFESVESNVFEIIDWWVLGDVCFFCYFEVVIDECYSWKKGLKDECNVFSGFYGNLYVFWFCFFGNEF